MCEPMCIGILIISAIILILLFIIVFLPCRKIKWSKNKREFADLKDWYKKQKKIVENGGTYTVSISCNGKKDFGKKLFASDFAAENKGDNNVPQTQTEPKQK